jgi:hypothetical protein
MAKINKTATKARNTKVVSGIDKDLAKTPQIQLAGEQFTPSSLKAVFQADNDAIDATDAARAALAKAILDEKATHARTAIVLFGLHSYLLATYGKQAVTILDDFGFKAPKSTATKSVATKAVAQVKAKATRQARNTRGSQQKKEVAGNVDTSGLEAALTAPVTHASPTSTAPTPPSPAASPSAPTGAPTPPAPAYAPPATPAVAPAGPAKAGTLTA